MWVPNTAVKMGRSSPPAHGASTCSTSWPSDARSSAACSTAAAASGSSSASIGMPVVDPDAQASRGRAGR